MQGLYSGNLGHSLYTYNYLFIYIYRYAFLRDTYILMNIIYKFYSVKVKVLE